MNLCLLIGLGIDLTALLDSTVNGSWSSLHSDLRKTQHTIMPMDIYLLNAYYEVCAFLLYHAFLLVIITPKRRCPDINYAY